MFAAVIRRIPWLSLSHPLTARELRRVHRDLPKFFQKLTDFWTSLGYAALIHGAFFVLALLTYGRLMAALPTLLMPFLTPFGTPIGLAMLHSILYWAMMIGICNQTTYLVARDVEVRTWAVLRSTPYTGQVILGAKLRVVASVWTRVLRSLFITRVWALILIPTAFYLQKQSSDAHPLVVIDLLSAFVFVVQPFVDALLVGSLSAVSGLIIANTTWAKIGAYGLVALVYGAVNGLGAFWLLFRTPLGGLAGLLVPLGHWAPLVAEITPRVASAELTERMIAVVACYFVLPLVISFLALSYARRKSNQVY